jgi:Gpi18-like mannosyltransferase
MKKILLTLIAAIMLICVFTACSSYSVDYDVQLISNGGFENSSNGWTLINDSASPVTPVVKSVAAGSDEDNQSFGSFFINITASSGGTYCYYTQPVKLERNAVYKLSVNMRVNSTITSSSTTGAFFGLAAAAAVRTSMTATTSGWVTKELYFRNTTYDTVNVRLGLGTETSTVSAGGVSFDNISLTKVTPPVETYIATIGETTTGNYSISKEGTVFTVLIGVLTPILCYALYTVLRRLMSVKNSVSASGAVKGGNFFTSPTFLLAIALLLAFGLRLLMVSVIYGYGPSVNDLGTTAASLAESGPVKYYFDNNSAYTPGVLYILWIMGLIAKPLGLLTGSSGLAIFMKIPAIIADLIAVFYIFNYASARYDTKRGAVFAALYAVLPTIFIASSVWSSYSSIGGLFLLLTFLAVLDKKHIKMTVFYSLAVLFMAEALLLLPLLLAYCIYIYIKDIGSRNVLPICMTASIIVTYLICLPFTWNFYVTGAPFIVLTRYIEMFTLNGLFSLNVFNFYGMITLNGAALNTAGKVLGALLSAAAMLFSAIAYYKCRNRLDMMLLASFVLVFMYMFGIRMSVWFIAPALLLMLFYSIMANENRVLLCFMGYSSLIALNSAYVLHAGGYIKGGFNTIANFVLGGSDPVLIIFSVLAVLLSFYFIYVTTMICFKDTKCDIPKLDKNYFSYIKELFSKKAQKAEETKPQ